MLKIRLNNTQHIKIFVHITEDKKKLVFKFMVSVSQKPVSKLKIPFSWLKILVSWKLRHKNLIFRIRKYTFEFQLSFVFLG